jgi:MerR family copper efflux transcriptional regulator
MRVDYGERDLRAAAVALELQARYRVTPAALAFGLRVLHDPEAARSLRRLARLHRGTGPDPVSALDFETAKARRLLRLAS